MCLLFWLAGAHGVEAAQVSWRSDFVQAARESADAQKPILLEITAPWCSYCHKMLEQTFTNQELAEQVNGCFVPVTVNADQHQKLVTAVGVKGLPTTVILSPELKVLKKITGYQAPAALAEVLGQVCQIPTTEAEADVSQPPAETQVAPVAFDGHCLVSLLDERQSLPGSAEFTTTYNGYTLCFATPEHRRRFQADPEKYWPAWDGRCVVSDAEEQVKRPGNLRWGAIYRGRMWIFADDAQRQKFMEEPGRYMPPTAGGRVRSEADGPAL